MRDIDERYISLFDSTQVTRDVNYLNNELEEAEIARFTPRELREYEGSRNAFRDLRNSLDTALRDGIKRGLEKGRAEGRAEGILSTARNLKSMGICDADIQKATGLPLDEIAKM